MAAHIHDADLDLAGNQLIGARWENRPSDPPDGRAGQYYFNTTFNRPRYHDGAKWVDVNPEGLVRRYQFFPPDDALSLTITVAPGTLPIDNNKITVTASGIRLLPNQGLLELDWARDPIQAPDTITLHLREGEWVLIEW